MTQAATTHISMTAPDISCAHCVATVQETVGALPGVETVTASADTKVVDVRFDAARTTVDQIAAALDDAGYPVQK